MDYHRLLTTLILASMLFGVGLIGIAKRRELWGTVVSTCIAQLAILLMLAGWQEFHGQRSTSYFGAAIATIVITECIVGSAFVSLLWRETKTANIDHWNQLGVDDQNLTQSLAVAQQTMGHNLEGKTTVNKTDLDSVIPQSQRKESDA